MIELILRPLDWLVNIAMSIPLNRLYLYLERVAQEIFGNDVIIYRFFPDGSKKIEDLQPLNIKLFKEDALQPEIFCNDQEPLNYQFYQNQPNHHKNDPVKNYAIDRILINNNEIFPSFNFRGQIRNIWDHALLVHSEKRSKEVELYRADQFIPVYYWNHAVIARDWFRYAEHVDQHKQTKKIFLIYNRAWAGTREYRLRFTELLVLSNLQNHCLTTINSIEPELNIHYKLHKFNNPIWQPQTALENYLPVSAAQSYYSAKFDIEDYESTDIEVVLETLFDDDRLHLTEKSLRPIACAQPFILAGTHGSLEYLRSYGFKTFGDLWDESYDLIKDPQLRMLAIIDLMKHIADWSNDIRDRKMAQAQEIADYNKKYFFSNNFHDTIDHELKNNFFTAFEYLKSNNTGKPYLRRRRVFQSIAELQPYISHLRLNNEADQIFELAKKYIK
jgi:hypothetical protein